MAADDASIRPVAVIEARRQQHARRVGLLRRHGEQAREGLRRLVVTLEVTQRAAAIVQRLGIVRCEAQGVGVGEQGFFDAAERAQGVAAIIVRQGEVGLERERAGRSRRAPQRGG